jgi:hypothetical protein
VDGILRATAAPAAWVDELEHGFQVESRGDGGIRSQAGRPHVLDRMDEADRETGPVRNFAKRPPPANTFIPDAKPEMSRQLAGSTIEVRLSRHSSASEQDDALPAIVDRSSIAYRMLRSATSGASGMS